MTEVKRVFGPPWLAIAEKVTSDYIWSTRTWRGREFERSKDAFQDVP